MCYQINTKYKMVGNYTCNDIIAPNKCVCNMENSITNGGLLIKHVEFASDGEELPCYIRDAEFKYYLKCNQNQLVPASGETCVIIVLTFLCFLFFIAACHFYKKSKKQTNSNDK